MKFNYLIRFVMVMCIIQFLSYSTIAIVVPVAVIDHTEEERTIQVQRSQNEVYPIDWAISHGCTLKYPPYADKTVGRYICSFSNGSGYIIDTDTRGNVINVKYNYLENYALNTIVVGIGLILAIMVIIVGFSFKRMGGIY